VAGFPLRGTGLNDASQVRMACAVRFSRPSYSFNSHVNPPPGKSRVKGKILTLTVAAKVTYAQFLEIFESGAVHGAVFAGTTGSLDLASQNP